MNTEVSTEKMNAILYGKTPEEISAAMEKLAAEPAFVQVEEDVTGEGEVTPELTMSASTQPEAASTVH